MTKFSDELFDDLMREHGPALANATTPSAPKRHVKPRRALMASGGGVLAVAAVAGTLVATSGSASPAYALTKNPNGTITLAVYQKSGIAEANAKLRLLGDKNVVLVPVEPGCPGISSLRKPAVPARISGETSTSVRGGNGGGTVTVDAPGIPDKDILVIAVQNTGQYSEGAGRLTSPPAPSCVSLPAPPVGNGGSGFVTTSG